MNRIESNQIKSNTTRNNRFDLDLLLLQEIRRRRRCQQRRKKFQFFFASIWGFFSALFW